MKRAPAVFIGHGSPMNAIAANAYTATLEHWGMTTPKPRAVLCVSAHWLTKGTAVTAMERPRTIHDFGGFPDKLFQVEYPAPGDPKLAWRMQDLIPGLILDPQQWGLDHGTWSVLRHVYPNADVPVLQLSIDYHQPPEFHFELGKKLAPLRDEGVMILGSGNIVHNLRRIDWDENAEANELGVKFDAWVKEKIEARDFKPLVAELQTPEAQFSVPTPDHYDPLLYILGASAPSDKMEFIYEGMQNASISMRSVCFS